VKSVWYIGLKNSVVALEGRQVRHWLPWRHLSTVIWRELCLFMYIFAG